MATRKRKNDPAPPDPDAAGLIPDATDGVDQEPTEAELALQGDLAAELSDDAIRPGETLHAWRTRIARG